MKFLHQLLSIPALAALLVAALPARAATGPGKPQALTSPDQVPEGLAKSDWSSIRAAYEAGRHAFQPTATGWQARNPGQQWSTQFDKRGFLTTPKDGGWQWGLELQSYGFAENPTAISGTPAVRADGQRLSYQWDANVQEWFVNDARGLEHGFTVKQRPALNSPSATLDFLLGVRGGLRPQVTGDTLGVEFRDAAGATVLNYSGLKVWDADGKVLASRFAAAGENQVRLLVDERGARYPLTIDPIAQQAYLKASNNGGPSEDNFGVSVAVSGETVVVGANQEDSSTTGVNSTPDESAANAGAAYVFVRSGGAWTQQAYLKASQVTLNDQFGVSVAVSGDTVVVGANAEDSSTTGVNSTPNESGGNAGAAYVFVRSGGAWTQEAYLKASQVSVNDQFGDTVAVSGDTVVVGASNESSSTTGVNSTPNESAPGSGAAYVFLRSGTTWTQQAYLKASEVINNHPFLGDQFGISVAVSGDTVVVGASNESSSTTGVNSTPNESASQAGAAYVFVRSGTTWTQQAYLKASQVDASDTFGLSVAVSVDTVVVGGNLEDSSTTGVNSTPDESAADSGAAYVFLRSGTTWTQQAYLKASNTPSSSSGEGDGFGNSVAVSVDTVVVGAPREDGSSTGVNSTPNELATDAGAAYVFVRSGTSWTQQAYLKASQVSAADQFGNSVAVSGDTVVVGAWEEDSSTAGVNSTPNESGGQSGAAYVFVRSGTTWTQQAYLKASQVSAGDGFGFSVAVSVDTVVVGATIEDSSTTGVNSTPNESASGSGAAYVFVRSGTTWTQQAYLKASQVNASDTFGQSVAVSGNTVVVGATGEASSTTGVNSTPNELAGSAGAAYVFVRSGTTWTQQAYLKASQVNASDTFGRSVAVSGDTVVVGAYLEDSSTTGVNSMPNESADASGAAYVFVRSGATWTQQAYLKASQVTAGDNFGASVAVSGVTVVVGSPTEDSSTTGVNSTPNESASGSGAAYTFTEFTNTAPLATAQSVTTAEDTAVAITLAGTDADGNPLTYAVAAGPAHGSLSGSAPNLSYTPTANYYGSDSFTFKVNDGTVDSATATVSITVTEVKAVPVFSGYTATVKTGKTLAIAPAKILARASDPDGGAVTLTRVFGPSAQGGTVSLTGTLNYTPDPSFTGTDSFDIELTASQGGTLRATLTVTVTGDAATGFNQTELNLHDGVADLTFRGIPGRSYTIQRSTNLATWTNLATVTAAADGKIRFTDTSPPQPSGYYRTQN